MNSYYKAKDKLVKMYIKSLEEGNIPWEKMWTTSAPYNPVKKTEYRGTNNLLLSLISLERGYKDNRWCTYKNITDNNWKLVNAKGMGVHVEYVLMKNIHEKKNYKFDEYRKIITENPEMVKDFRPNTLHYVVFNAEHIEGIPKDNEIKKEQIINNDYIKNIVDNLGVKYVEKGDEAYYNIQEDEVVIPEPTRFKNNYAYYSTQLHELAHSTGHESRLDRDIKNKFGTPEYAKEELRAEISSSFLMQKLGLEYDEKHLNNHKAYVKNWLDILKEKPQELFSAIKDANKIVSYLEEQSLTKEQNISKEIDEMEMEYA
ncbi:MAG: DUF1738 domain-containing protein [Bacilli bacterium]|nr:DUF1738 domain-containing protein [Bacilli bacterium]MBQ3511807.1 DUF1738 domain-containing protein [Bacilli bacterium]